MKKTSMQMMKTHENSLYELMPESIQHLVDVIGMSATLALIEAFGGLDYHMPKSMQADNARRLINVVGRLATAKLIHTYGGERVYINRCESLRLMLRNQAFFNAVLSKMEMGMSQTRAIQEIAPMFDITERYAYELLKQQQTPEPKYLFDF